jgi:fatty-acyl-CoA synthase
LSTGSDRDSVFPVRVTDRLAELGEAVLFEYADGEVTAAETLSLVKRVTAALLAAGAGPGDGVALMAGVTPTAFAANLAAHVVGGRVSGVRPGLTEAPLGYLLDERITYALTDATTATEIVLKARPDLVLIDLEQLADAEEQDLAPRGRLEDVARVTYTSGSTGNPKGCAQTYAGVSADWPSRTEFHSPAIRDLGSRLDRYLLHGTLSSQVMLDYAFLAMHHGASGQGGRLIIPTQNAPFPELVAKYRITGSILPVPRLLALLAAVRVGSADASSLRGLMVSGSPLDPHRYAEAQELLGPIVFQGYGQSETGLVSMLTPTEALASPIAMTSVGRPLPRNQIETREGEIYLKTPQQTIGYVNEGDILNEQPGVYLEGGWIRSRDLGGLDEEGFLHLEGRSRDVIIVNANVHYAGPIERALAEHPLVDSAYVVGEPDEVTGEAVQAFVVLRASAQVPDEELRQVVVDRLGPACVPQTFTVIDQIPLTPGGKPDKKVLRRV